MPEDLSAVNPSVIEDLAALAAAQVGIVYAGIGVPQVEATDDPPELDGDNDPWFQYDPPTGQFYSPTYEVTWLAGDEIPSVGDDTFQTPDEESVFNLTTMADASWNEYRGGSADIATVATCADDVITFTADGSGILGLRISIGTDPPVDPSADVSLLFGDLTVVGPYTFPAATPAVALFGDDGTYYMDTTEPASPVLYGPKTAGDWGDGTAIG